MKCVYILHILLGYQVWQLCWTKASSSSSSSVTNASTSDPGWNTTTKEYENQTSSSSAQPNATTDNPAMKTSTAKDWNYTSSTNTTDAASEESTKESSFHPDTSPFLANITDQGQNFTDIGNIIWTQVIEPWNPIEDRNYALSLQVEECGVFCDGVHKRFTESQVCGPYTCSECNCDELCSAYGDCCPDENGTIPVPTPDERITCVGPGAFSTFKSYYMIKGCPSDFTVDTAMEDLHPVTSLETNQTYYNEFYALCNNDENFLTWLFDTFCHSSFSSDNNLTTETCETFYQPTPSSFLHRNCSWHKTSTFDNIVDRCNISGNETYVNSALKELCESTDYPIGLDHNLYKNIFCYNCNGGIPPWYCMPQPPPIGKPSDAVVSSEILTNFKEDGDMQVLDELQGSNNCTESEWKDPATGECRQILCMMGRHLSEGECIAGDHRVNNTEYFISMQFPLQEDSLYYGNWNDVVRMFKEAVPVMIAQYDPLVYTFFVDSMLKCENGVVISNNTVGLTLTFRSLKQVEPTQYENDLIDVLWDDWIFIQNHTEIILKPHTWDSSFSYGDLYTFNYDPINKTCCTSTSYRDLLGMLSGIIDGFSEVSDEFISLTDALPCPFIVLNYEEYTMSSDDTLTFSSTNMTLQAGEYFKASYAIHVCTSTLQQLYRAHKVKRHLITLIKGYLSLICTCFSLVCILLTLITFFKFPALLSLPNKNTMALAMSIFAAQATFQFGAAQTGNKIVCQIVGIVIHYLWLSVIFWMNVCCYHMFRVFVASKARKAHSSHWKCLLKYAFYVYGMSSAIVSSTIAASYAMSNGTNIGYGDRLCYINDPLVIGLAFTLPLGVIIIVNTLFFSWTIYTIHRISKVEESSSADRRNVFVYIKLSTLTGAFWILAILAEVTDVTALSFISIILNGSQGMFIFVSYILNRRVYRLWARSCGKKEKITSSQYTNSTKF